MQTDTVPEMEALRDQRIARMSGAERLEVAASLTSAVRELALAGLRQRHPAASDEEIRCRLAVLLYGREIAARAFRDVPADAT